MKTRTLYRPVGLKEMELIADSNYEKYPPRLEWQPIFYPVLNQTYAEQIAEQWNVPDSFSEYCGIVTSFEISQEYLSSYEVKNVGGNMHDELWIPSEELETFNQNIIGKIQIVKTFLGKEFKLSQNDELNNKIMKVKNNEHG